MTTRSGNAFLKAQSNGFTILQWNAGGLSSSKFLELRKIAEEQKADVLVILEANITENRMEFFQLKGFTTYGLYKKRQIASGILVGIRDSLTAKFEPVKEMDNYDKSEIVKINITINENKFIIYGIYSPPNNKNLNLENLIIGKNTILVGDFNAASPIWGYPSQNQIGKIVEDLTDSNALIVLYDKKEPKSFIHYSGSTTNPDLVIVTANIQDSSKKKVIGDPGSGHRIVMTTYESIQKTKREASRTLWNFKKAKWKDYTSTLESKVEKLPKDVSPHKETLAFVEAILQSAKINIPRGKNHRYKPFWNEELETQREKRDRAREIAEKVVGKTEEERRQDVTKWRRESAVMKKEILEAKRSSWNEFLSELDYRKDGPKAFRLINTLNNRSKKMNNHPIKIGDKEVSDPKLIAQKFNEQYLGKFKLDKKKKRMERKFKSIISNAPERQEELFNESFSIEELNKAISDLQKHKQPGPDKIFPEFIINLGEKAKKFLLNIYNKFWNLKLSLPADWVKAKVIPLHKPNKPREEIESYRPISLTSIVVKTMERMISSRLRFFLETSGIIREEQAGFRNNMSTANSILKLVQEIKTGFSTRKSTLAVFVDFQGAYDSVWRNKLLFKLQQNGIGGKMLSWYRRFLSQRWCKTSWRNTESKYQQSKVGLPQGAVSSCTLFNLYTNDLIEKMKMIAGIKVSMFADDMVIWTEEKNLRNYRNQQVKLENTMNKALEAIRSWSEENNMSINNSKTVYQFFSMRHVNADFKLEIGNNLLSKSPVTKYLGITLDNKLSFRNHAEQVRDKVEERSKVLKRLAGVKWGCDQNTLNKTYNLYVKPVIKYGSEIMITSSQDKINILERAQNKSLRIITGAVKTTPVAAMQLYTANNSIHYEIMKQAIGIFVKMKHSGRAEWTKSYEKSTMKTQISPVETFERILEELGILENNVLPKRISNPLEFMKIERLLPNKEVKKKTTPEMLLRALSLDTLNEKYPIPEWTRIYTDGSQTTEKSGAGVFCELFSRSAPVGKYMTNYDAEISAINLALRDLRMNEDFFTKAVILVDSSSAIQGVTENQSMETSDISEIRSNLRALVRSNKRIVFQWIPSHVGIEGNEKADALAKKGTELSQEGFSVPIMTLKKYAQRKVTELQRDIISDLSRGKLWENIQEDWSKMCNKPRKEAVAFFRIKTGHDCLAEHLHRMGFLQTKECQICGDGTLNAMHLPVCRGLNHDAQERGNLPQLYWEARSRLLDLQGTIPT